jgi:hypothetical protein
MICNTDTLGGGRCSSVTLAVVCSTTIRHLWGDGYRLLFGVIYDKPTFIVSNRTSKMGNPTFIVSGMG